MAGVPAGQLSIEIVAEIARLQQDLDKAKRLVGQASKEIGASARVANDNIGKMGASSKLAGHHLSNLSFQLQDIVVGLQSGQKPMTVFLQQGGQIAQIMGQAGIGVGGLVKQVGLMAFNFAKAHPIVLALTTAIGLGAAAFKRFTGEIEQSGELQKFVDGLGLTKDELEELGPVTITAGDAIKGLWRTIDEGLGLSDVFSSIADWASKAFTILLDVGRKSLAGVYAAVVGTYNGIKATWSMMPSVFGNAVYSAANVVIEGLNWLIRQATTLLNLHIAAYNALPFMDDIAFLKAPQIDKLTDPFKGAGAAAGKAFVDAYRGAFNDAISGMDAFGRRLADNIVDAAKERIGARAGEIIDDRTEKAAGRAGKKAGEKFAMTFREAFADIAEYFERIMAASADTQKLEEQVALLEREAKVLGLTGAERARRLEQLEYEAKRTEILNNLKVAEVSQREQEADQYRKQLELLDKIHALKVGAIDFADQAEKDAEALRRVNEQLMDMAALFERIGGAAGIVGGIIGGLQSGNWRGLGTFGELLNIALQSQADTDKQIKKLAESIQGLGKTIGFDLPIELSTSIAQALQGAGIGLATGQMVAGKDYSTSEQIGAAIGGIGGYAIGGPIGAMIGSAVGTLAGSLFNERKPSVPGLIIGGLLGGIPGALAGGLLFGSSKYGTSTVSNLGIGTVGNTDPYKAASLEAGQSLQDMLASIAESLDASIGSYLVSLGQFKGKWRVSGSGMTGKLKGGDAVDFGKDGAEAALRYALADAIRDGAITGVRAGTQALLQKEGDIEAQLQKALTFEGVFKELAAQTNPLKAAFDELANQFGKLRAIFTEAGATAEEYAQLEELLALRQKQLIEQASASYRSTFWTDAQNVAWARSQIADTLGPLGFGNVDTVNEYRALVDATDPIANPELYGALMALVDAFGLIKDAAEQAAQQAEAAAAAEALLLQQRQALEIQILQAQGRTAEALAKQRAMELAAADASLRPLMEELFRAQDIAAAKDELAAAYERESRGLQTTIDRMKSLGESLREVRASIYGSDAATGGYDRALAELRRVGGSAAAGDETAMGQLGGAIRDFLPAALANARTLQDYQRAQALAARYADSAISASDIAVSLATQQLDEMKAQVGQLIDLNETALSVEEALQRLAGMGATPVVPTGPANPSADDREREERANSRADRIAARMEEREERRQRREERMLGSIERLENLWNRLTPDGLALTIRTDDDTPIRTETV